MSYGSACMHHMENTFACLAGGEAGDGVGSGRTAEGRWRQTCISISRAPCRELAAACTTHELSMHSPGAHQPVQFVASTLPTDAMEPLGHTTGPQLHVGQ